MNKGYTSVGFRQALGNRIFGDCLVAGVLTDLPSLKPNLLEIPPDRRM